MIDEYKKDYIKGKRVVKRIFIILILASIVLIGIKILKDVGGVVLLPVKRVVVYGNRYVSNKEIIKLLELGPTTSILSINRSKAAKNIEENPRIETAVVVKVYPDTIKVYLKEKSVLLPLMAGSKWYAISRDGVILGELEGKSIDVRPYLQILNYDDIRIGDKLDNFLIRETLKAVQKLSDEDNNFFSQIDKLSVQKSGVYVNLKNDRYRVYLGDNINPDVFLRLKALIAVLENSKEADGKKHISVNMSFSYASVKIRE